jgi:hypothetical protein
VNFTFLGRLARQVDHPAHGRGTEP